MLVWELLSPNGLRSSRVDPEARKPAVFICYLRGDFVGTQGYSEEESEFLLILLSPYCNPAMEADIRL